MKLRQLPEDFLVEEKGGFNTKEEGGFRLYLLEKRGLESFSLLSYLARKNKIPVSCFGFAGMKDRHAVTRQYLTIPSEYRIETLSERNFRLEFIGFVDEEIRRGSHTGNSFRITVRDLGAGEADAAMKKTSPLCVPNYFDSQRFGSAVERRFIIKDVIAGDFEAAVKAFLTSYSRKEKSGLKAEKKRILANWSRLAELRTKNPVFERVIREYRESGSWLSAYKKIPLNLREFFVSAYQGFLWNECAKELLKDKVGEANMYPVKYALGSLLFLKEGVAPELPASLKTIGEDMHLSCEESLVVGRVLSSEGLRPEDFDIREKTGNFFASYERPLMLKPEGLSASPPEPDELNQGRSKVLVSFSLPKGSYATVVLKGLFGE